MQTQMYSAKNVPIPSDSLPTYERVMTFMANNNDIKVNAYAASIYFTFGKKKVIVKRHEVFKMDKEQAKAFFVNSIYNPLKGKKA